MFEALHPTVNQLITFSEYIKFALDQGYRKANDAPAARCPVCEREMRVRAGKKKDDGHFYHNDNIFCPTKDPARRPYEGLAPTHVDPLVVQHNRNFVQINMQKIWARLTQIVPYLDLKEFINNLAEARRLNVYGYAGLNPQLIPYVFVTLINFQPNDSRGKQRKLKFCFFYESKIKTYDDLWINIGEFSRLTRISFSNSTTQKVKIIETTTDYLLKDDRWLTENQINWCLREM